MIIQNLSRDIILRNRVQTVLEWLELPSLIGRLAVIAYFITISINLFHCTVHCTTFPLGYVGALSSNYVYL